MDNKVKIVSMLPEAAKQWPICPLLAVNATDFKAFLSDSKQDSMAFNSERSPN
jgi:hypothetical protein